MKKINLLGIVIISIILSFSIHPTYSTNMAQMMLCDNDPTNCPGGQTILQFPLNVGTITLGIEGCTDQNGLIYQSSNSTWTCNVNTGTIISLNTNKTSQTGNIGTTTLLTPSKDGLYRISVYQDIGTAGLGGTLASTIGWTDSTGTAQTALPATNLSLLTLNSYSSGSIYIEAKSGTNITYKTNLSGLLGNPQYNIYLTVEKLS